MKNILFLFVFLFVFSISAKAETPQWLIDAECLAVYQVPEGAPYSGKIVRPPFWELTRWECLVANVSDTEFQNSPANGTDTVFYLALPYVIDVPTITYYPILYINESYLHIYENDGLVPTERFDFATEQGTGKITFEVAPTQGHVITFRIITP